MRGGTLWESGVAAGAGLAADLCPGTVAGRLAPGGPRSSGGKVEAAESSSRTAASARAPAARLPLHGLLRPRAGPAQVVDGSPGALVVGAGGVIGVSDIVVSRCAVDPAEGGAAAVRRIGCPRLLGDHLTSNKRAVA
jgi:hypothetical protein